MCALLLLACSLPSQAVAEGTASAAVFKDRTAELGLASANGKACWADLDGDGWVDLCCGGVVWRNAQGKRFHKAAEGLGDMVAADLDNDGLVDLFSFSTLKALRNAGLDATSGKLTFTPLTMPQLPKCVSIGACAGDLNGDGFVDLYVGGYEDWDAGITYPSFVLLNEKGKEFKLAWTEARHRTRGVTACDFDQDGHLDVYVSNYRLQPNSLWKNDGKGEFKDVAGAMNAVGTSAGFEGGHSIGAAWGDFDEDGAFDLFVGNFAHVDDRGDQPKSRFLRNRGPAADKSPQPFDDRGPCGVPYQESYASPAAGDFDNDGRLDLFFTTVYGVASFGRKNNPILFRNKGEFQFADVTAAAKLNDLEPTYQAAWADFDQDGDLDLMTAGKLFENQSRGGHWLEVRLVGAEGINRSGLGAQVRIKVGDRTLTRQVEAGTGEGNQNDLTLHFGLGSHSEPVDLTILWPKGINQSVRNVPADRLTRVRFEPQP